MNSESMSFQSQSPEPAKIRILLVDDHAVVRRGLRVQLHPDQRAHGWPLVLCRELLELGLRGRPGE